MICQNGICGNTAEYEPWPIPLWGRRIYLCRECALLYDAMDVGIVPTPRSGQSPALLPLAGPGRRGASLMAGGLPPHETGRLSPAIPSDPGASRADALAGAGGIGSAGVRTDVPVRSVAGVDWEIGPPPPEEA